MGGEGCLLKWDSSGNVRFTHFLSVVNYGQILSTLSCISLQQGHLLISSYLSCFINRNGQCDDIDIVASNHNMIHECAFHIDSMANSTSIIRPFE